MNVYRGMERKVCNSKDVGLDYARTAAGFDVTENGIVQLRHASAAVDVYNVRTQFRYLGNAGDADVDGNAGSFAFISSRASFFQRPYGNIVAGVLCDSGTVYEKSRCAAISEFIANLQYSHFVCLAFSATRHPATFTVLLAVIHKSIVFSE